MTAAYDALLASVTPDFVVLAEVQPMEPLAGWTAAGGGLTNTYYCAFLSQIATTIVPGGLYRRLDFVRQNATTLTSRASAALVDANLGSYFLDTSTNRLYVSMNTGASPDTFALVGAWFTLFLTTTAVSLSGQPLYAPIITDTLPTVSGEMPDTLFGATIAAAGSLSLLNTDGLFDRLSKQYVWRNKLVTFKLGGGSLAYSDFTTIETLHINNLAVNDERVALQLENVGSVLNQSLPVRTWGDGTANAFGPVPIATDILGKSQPLVFGRLEACPFVLATSDVVAAGLPGEGTVTRSVWLAYDSNGGTYGTCDISHVIAIHRSSKFPTPLQFGVDYTVSGAAVTVINLDYMDNTHDLVGTLNNIAFAGSAAFGAMARAILELCGEATANLDTAAFDAANLAAPQVLARYLDAPRTGADLMRELEQSVNGQVYKGADGRWTCRLLTPDIPATVVDLTDADFASWGDDGDDANLRTTLNEVRVSYAHAPNVDNWMEVGSSDDAVLYGAETSDAHRLDTWLTVEADAIALAGHLRFFRATPPSIIGTEQRGLSLISARIGDLVSVTRTRAPNARTGTYDTHLLRLVKIAKALGGDVPAVQVALEDLGGQTDRIGRYTDTTPIAWSTATAAQRARYGFYADANGYLDAADPQTHNAKVYW